MVTVLVLASLTEELGYKYGLLGTWSSNVRPVTCVTVLKRQYMLECFIAVSSANTCSLFGFFLFWFSLWFLCVGGLMRACVRVCVCLL